MDNLESRKEVKEDIDFDGCFDIILISLLQYCSLLT